MSQNEFYAMKSILEIWKIAVQSVLFLSLCAAVFENPKQKRKSIAASLFILVNIGIGLLPWNSWVRYGISAILALCYGMAYHTKYLKKAFFLMPAFYNFHCLSFLIANSIYIKITDRMMKGLEVLPPDFQNQMYDGLAVGMFLSVFVYTVLLASMTVLIGRLIKGTGIMAWQDVLLLSVLNLAGSMTANAVNDLFIVKIDKGAFI